jgi:hypothetical protein
MLNTILDDISNESVLISKWGCYAALYASTSNGHWKTLVTAIFFITSVVPLQLYQTKTPVEKVILWQNSRSSVRYCHPIQIQFQTETVALAN